MEKVTASEMMEIHIVLKWLTAQEDFILFICCESSNSCTGEEF
jgi:hypothetical protein